MREQFYNPELERLEQFAELRKKTHEKIEVETAGRIKDDPKPTDEEIRVGAFREMIEPQVRDALFEFFRTHTANWKSESEAEMGSARSAVCSTFPPKNPESERIRHATNVARPNILKANSTNLRIKTLIPYLL
ncbi:MAG: hypothetical protein ABH888_03590 [Patescibacteria group bacterium]